MHTLLGPLRPANFLYAPNFLPVDPHPLCRSWAEMECFHQEEVNLAILTRSPLHCPLALAELLEHPTGVAQLAVERGADPATIPAELDDTLDLQAEDSYGLYADIQHLAECFFEITAATRIGVRLERIENDSCRLLHVDHVEARLITTYFGRGTEWVRNEHVNRKGLGKGDNEKVLKEEALVQRFEPGWVGLLKGERKNFGRGIVHRSPSIDGTGQKRILLRMDVLD